MPDRCKQLLSSIFDYTQAKRNEICNSYYNYYIKLFKLFDKVPQNNFKTVLIPNSSIKFVIISETYFLRTDSGTLVSMIKNSVMFSHKTCMLNQPDDILSCYQLIHKAVLIVMICKICLPLCNLQTETQILKLFISTCDNSKLVYQQLAC